MSKNGCFSQIGSAMYTGVPVFVAFGLELLGYFYLGKGNLYTTDDKLHASGE